MLEFYYKYHTKLFRSKSKKLADEITSILVAENISLRESNEIQIPLEYKQCIGEELFWYLNNLYFTLRQKPAKDHFLLKKYLPELKESPMSDLLFADFFSGAGGLSQGLVNAGFQPAFVNDNYTNAIETYYFNHSLSLDRFYVGDIRSLVDNIEQFKNIFRNIKIIAGGPPCQGFSTANRWNFEKVQGSQRKRFIEDERNVLYKYFVKLLSIIDPDFFIMENVRGMMRVKEEIVEDITEATKNRYYFIPLVLDAQNFNIPQSRIRYFLIGGKDFFFIEQLRSRLEGRKNEKSIFKLQDALFGLPEIATNPLKLRINHESELNGYAIRKKEISQNTFLEEINKGFNSGYVLNHKSRYNNENDIEIFKSLPEGENSLHESIRHLNKYNNRNHIFKDKYYKLKRDEVCKTITSHMKYDCHMYIHPQQSRGLSPREAARIQTFPDDYLFRGSLNDWYKQIGNAVPVKLAEIIAKEIRNYYK